MTDSIAMFTENEGRRILERAAERQEEAERAQLGAGGGLSLSDLQEIAGDVGIDPSHVQAAARELVLYKDRAPAKAVLGVPSELNEMRMLPGTVSDNQWEQMVGVFRETFGRSGIVSQFGDVREWISTNANDEAMPVKIRLEPGEDGVLVTFHQRTALGMQLTTLIPGMFGLVALVFLILVLTGAAEPALIALPAIFGGLASAGFVGGWAGSGYWAKAQRQRFQSAADKVELIGRPEE